MTVRTEKVSEGMKGMDESGSMMQCERAGCGHTRVPVTREVHTKLDALGHPSQLTDSDE